MLIFAIPSAGYLCLRSTTVQTWLTQLIANNLSESIGAEIGVGGVDFSPFKTLVLNDLYILDLHSDTLFKTNSLGIDIDEFDLDKKIIQLHEVELHNPCIKLKRYQNESDFNYQFLIDQFNSDDTTGSWKIQLSSLEILNAKILFKDENKVDSVDQAIVNFNDLEIVNININATDLFIIDDTIKTNIKFLCLKDKSGFQLDSFATKAAIIPNLITLTDLNIKTPQSNIFTDLSMKYDSISDFSDFINKIYIKSKFQSSHINITDIAFFTTTISNNNEEIKLSGDIKGRINNLKGKKLDIAFGKNSFIRGNIKLSGLPNIQETFIDIKVQEGQTTKYDLETVPMELANESVKAKLPENMSKLGKIRFKGRFTGFMTDFVAKANFRTNLGTISSDLNMKINAITNETNYSGHIVTNNFELGDYINSQDILGKVSVDATIKGQGLKLDDLAANIEGRIDEIELRNYTYKNCTISGNFTKQLFSGDLIVADENLNLDFKGTIDLSNDIPVFDFSSKITNANLFKQNLLTLDSYAYKQYGNLILNSDLELHFEGNSIDNLQGIIKIDNTIAISNRASHRIGSIHFTSQQLEGNNKELIINSEIANANIKGEFNLNDIQVVLNDFMNYYLPAMFKDTIQGNSTQKQDFTFALNFKNTKLINDLILPIFFKENTYRIPENSKVEGKFNNDEQQISFKIDLDKLTYQNSTLKDLHIEVFTKGDSLKVYSDFSELSTSNFSLKQSSLSTTVYDNNILFFCDANDQLGEKLLKFGAHASFYQDTIILIDLLPSEVTFANKIWKSDPYNSINASRSVIDFNNILFSNENQEISINGTISDDLNEEIMFDLMNFDLDNLNSILKISESSKINGITNGSVYLSGLKENPQFSGDFEVSHLSLSDHELGNGFISLDWQKKTGKLNINSNIQYENTTTLSLFGSYWTNSNDNKLDFDLKVTPVPINVLDNILKPNITDIDGKLASHLKITGNLKEPDITGSVKLEDVGFTLSYLNTHYETNDLITFKENKIIFEDFVLTDIYGKTATANGHISHAYFSDFDLNINLTTNNFLCLNTTGNDNDLYYGQGFATGNINFDGTIERPIINIAAKTEPNTQLFIPLTDFTEIGNQKFVTFIQKNKEIDTTTTYKVDLSGIQLNFDLEITPDAELQLIFDPTIGDIVKCYGNANLNMEVNTLGTFNMYGDYILEKGDYLFTFKDVINKRFKVQDGGRISWNGDPYFAKIELTAIYKLRTQLLSLMEMGNNENILDEELAAYKKRVPIECKLNMTGDLLSPQIDFSIDCKDNIPDLARFELQALQNDQLEMNRQIFGLLALNRFLPKEDFNLSQGNVIGSNARELLSNQVSNWLSQYRDDIDLGIYYHGQDSLSNFITKRELQVALTKRFLDDRLSVNIDGNFELGNSDLPKTNDKKYIIGDFTIEYKLTPDGKVRIKSFHKTYNDLLGYNYISKQGIGIFFKEEFNSLSDLKKLLQPSNSSL